MHNIKPSKIIGISSIIFSSAIIQVILFFFGERLPMSIFLVPLLAALSTFFALREFSFSRLVYGDNNPMSPNKRLGIEYLIVRLTIAVFTSGLASGAIIGIFKESALTMYVIINISILAILFIYYLIPKNIIPYYGKRFEAHRIVMENLDPTTRKKSNRIISALLSLHIGIGAGAFAFFNIAYLLATLIIIVKHRFVKVKELENSLEGSLIEKTMVDPPSAEGASVLGYAITILLVLGVFLSIRTINGWPSILLLSMFSVPGILVVSIYLLKPLWINKNKFWFFALAIVIACSITSIWIIVTVPSAFPLTDCIIKSLHSYLLSSDIEVSNFISLIVEPLLLPAFILATQVVGVFISVELMLVGLLNAKTNIAELNENEADLYKWTYFTRFVQMIMGIGILSIIIYLLTSNYRTLFLGLAPFIDLSYMLIPIYILIIIYAVIAYLNYSPVEIKRLSNKIKNNSKIIGGKQQKGHSRVFSMIYLIAFCIIFITSVSALLSHVHFSQMDISQSHIETNKELDNLQSKSEDELITIATSSKYSFSRAIVLLFLAKNDINESAVGVGPSTYSLFISRINYWGDRIGEPVSKEQQMLVTAFSKMEVEYNIESENAVVDNSTVVSKVNLYLVKELIYSSVFGTQTVN